MELFSEVYGCYYTVVTRILNRAQDGLTRAEIEELVKTGGFYESALHLLPALFSDEWKLLDKKASRYYSRLGGQVTRPLTALEKSWLKSLTDDPRIRLFLSEQQLSELEKSLEDVLPLYHSTDFHTSDRLSDSDDFSDPEYISHFRIVLQAIREHRALFIGYESPGGTRTRQRYLPYKLSYSGRDDKFRLLCATLNKRQNRLQRMTLNLTRMKSAQIVDGTSVNPDELAELFRGALCTEPILLEISTERNALERCMLQFAAFERQTTYDRENDLYTCRIWYNTADESELLIRILSFGPTIKVLEPQRLVEQIKDRIRRQLELNRASNR